jgi:hypothetical protein
LPENSEVNNSCRDGISPQPESNNL